ncbi:DNA transposase [Frankliniella fusca]|uniref:DNA transposase n=1 Tax=Frankliniella fusca TaxID=407009 RepID=A0AAE1GW87_9NEOP|nr:DNA transposase [Frankliniella fusca]
MDVGDSSTSESTESAPSRRGKQKVPRRKLMKKPKRRGEYKPKATLGPVDLEVAECLFSDDDVRADFLDNVSTADMQAESEQNVQTTDASDSGSTSSVFSEMLSDTASDMSIVFSPPASNAGSRRGSLSDSRPSSANESRPSSVSEMGPPSSVESESRRSTDILAPSPTEHDSTQSSSSSKEISSGTCDLMNKLGVLPSVETTDASANSPSTTFIASALQECRSILPAAWVAIADKICLHLLLFSVTTPKAIQREIVLFYDGRVSMFVHDNTIFSQKILSNYPVPSLLSENNVLLTEFCQMGLKLISCLMDYSVCVGANYDKSRCLWSCIPQTYVDYNPHREESYKETCRSVNCSWLVKESRKQISSRCLSCEVVWKSLKRREKSATSESPDPSTPNIYLTPAQSLSKLKVQHDAIKSKDKQIAYYKSVVTAIIDKEGVDIDDDISKSLVDILSKCQNLSHVQKMFIQEQVSRGRKKDARTHKWHPAMIWLALHLKMLSPSTVDALRDSGVISLPCNKTLFDYSHAIVPENGVSGGILQMIHDRVQKFEKKYQQFHNLLCDEMYVSQNLVYRQSDNSLVGYAHLDDVDKELKSFENFVEQQFTGVPTAPEKTDLKLAKTVVAYMVKGVASNVKYVVASFPMFSLNAELLYARSWEVILGLEKAGVKVISFIFDGAAVNRTFINMHQPITKVPSGVVFDTINFCSPERRPLYFISDVCHLLKTARNCFHNSGDGDNKPRCMQINGQKIMWKHIIRLYFVYKNYNFRASYKLSAQNVFPNAFSGMKVRYAAQVLSETVANDLEAQNWENTEETVRFIRYFNKFFDCLNGAFKGQHFRTRNNNLAEYTDVNDPRFAWLGVPNPGHELDSDSEMPFLEYLQEWSKQIKTLPIDDKLKPKLTLSIETLKGIEISIRGFAGATRYLLSLPEEPINFVIARVFSQDPLEQHFSLQRAGGGGNRNINVAKFQSKQVSLAVQRDLGVRTRKSNVESTSQGFEWSDDPLAKRSRTSKKK